MRSMFAIIALLLGGATLAACGALPKPTTAASSRNFPAFLRFSECMRAHGVSDYPDPIFPRGGGIESIVPSSIAPGAPAFQTAAKACGGP